MASEQKRGAVKVGLHDSLSAIRHSIKAATLLYGSPQWVLRGPIWLTFLVVLVGLLFSIWGKKDILVVAPSTLQRESTTIEAIGGGMVTDIPAKENSIIEAGDLILTVQEQIRVTSSPEQQRMQDQIDDLEKERAKTKGDYEHKISQMEMEKRDIGNRRGTDVQALKARISQIGLQVQTAQRSRSSAAERLGQARRQLETKKKLYQSHDITVTEFEQAQLATSDYERAVNEGEAETQRQQLALQTAQQELQRLTISSDEERFKAEVAKLKENFIRDDEQFGRRVDELKARQKQSETLVRGVNYEGNMANYKSSFDGVLTNLHVRRGQIISSGQPLATIVKASAALEAQAYVQNMNIGNLKHGQSAKIKYFAFPYQEYGIQTGVIREISTQPIKEGPRAGMYRITIALDRETIKSKDGPEKQLAIGIEGVSEIKVGEKRFIELMFTPVSKFFNEQHKDAGSDKGSETSETGK